MRKDPTQAMKFAADEIAPHLKNNAVHIIKTLDVSGKFAEVALAIKLHNYKWNVPFNRTIPKSEKVRFTAYIYSIIREYNSVYDPRPMLEGEDG